MPASAVAGRLRAPAGPDSVRAASPRLGVDVGGTRIKWALLGDGDVVLRHGAVATPTSGVDATLAAVSQIAAEHAGADDTCVGVAVPGSVDHATSRVLSLPNLPGEWTDVLVADLLEARTQRPWRVLNDARAFAFGELRTGAARGASDALFITLGTGVGGALALHGAVEMGTGGLIGEIGHVCVEQGGRPCRCGGRGCLETYAGADGMVAEAHRRGLALEQPNATGSQTDPLSALFAAARSGHPDAAAIVAEAGAALGATIGRLATFLAPTVVVIGGGVSKAFADIEPHLSAALTVHHQVVPPPELRVTSRPDIAGAIGAALWARASSTTYSHTRETS
jgi:glucokinase